MPPHYIRYILMFFLLCVATMALLIMKGTGP